MKDNVLRKKIYCPRSFRMNSFKEMSGMKSYVELIGRDPLELIAYKLVDPTLMFLFKDDIQFEYKKETLLGGEVCFSNLMSSNYAKCTESNIKSLHSSGLLLPLIVYSDGVAMGLRSKVSKE